MRELPLRRFAADSGFTYIGVLLMVLLIGVGLAGAGVVWSTAAQRDREAELLFVGDQLRRAIGSYYDGSPGAKQFPRRLEDLLRDDRLPGTRRHLRRVFADPMTGKADWGLVMRGDRIVGVHSKSEREPFKRDGFAPTETGFELATSYREWRFVYAPAGGAAGAPVAPPLQSGPVSALSPISPSAAPPEAQAAPAPSRPAPVPKAAWVCTAERASDLRDCERTVDPSDDAGLQVCREEVNQRYRACIGPAATAAQ